MFNRLALCCDVPFLGDYSRFTTIPSPWFYCSDNLPRKQTTNNSRCCSTPHTLKLAAPKGGKSPGGIVEGGRVTKVDGASASERSVSGVFGRRYFTYIKDFALGGERVMSDMVVEYIDDP
eukprot:scaffold20095_cov91-Amphora_coffeaeformis.AAC.1